MTTPSPTQQGGTASPAQAQSQSQAPKPQQQGGTPVIRDWASI